MTRPDLSVIVVHHRGQEHLIEALDALAASSGVSFETVLVDNTAGRPMEDVLRRHPNLRRVVAGRNAGFARGCRLGAEAVLATRRPAPASSSWRASGPPATEIEGTPPHAASSRRVRKARSLSRPSEEMETSRSTAA